MGGYSSVVLSDRWECSLFTQPYRCFGGASRAVNLCGALWPLSQQNNVFPVIKPDVPDILAVQLAHIPGGYAALVAFDVITLLLIGSTFGEFNGH